MTARINPRFNHGEGTAQICNQEHVTIRVRKGKSINLSSIRTLAFRFQELTTLVREKTPRPAYAETCATKNRQMLETCGIKIDEGLRE
jgi:hypothetical protein